MSPEAIRAIVEERDTLREELRQLKAERRRAADRYNIDALRIAFPTLAPVSCAILAALVRRSPAVMTFDALLTARADGMLQRGLWPKQDAIPKLVNVHICHVRRAFREAGAPDEVIQTIWGTGYSCTPHGKTWIDAQLQERAR
jgi:hypothetical protein